MIRDKTNVPSCDVDDKPTTVTERREGTRRPLSRPTALRPAGPEDVDLSPCKSDLTAARRTHAPSLSVDFAPPSSVDFARPDPRAPLLPTVSRATTQPTLLPIRRYRASPVDTASCDDATDTVAHPTLQSIAACCNSAQQVCATTQPTLLQIRRYGASRVATALSRFVRRRNQRCCESVATAPIASDLVATALSAIAHCCNTSQSVATAHRLLQ